MKSLGIPFAILLAILAGTPQSGCGQTGIDVDRLMADVVWLADDAREGRQTGSPGAAAAADYLVGSLDSAGVSPFGEAFDREFDLTSRRGDSLIGRNLVGFIPGRVDSAGIIVLTAHYDHLGVRNGQVFNGADDNASGTAAVLAISHVLAAEPLRHTVVIALLDAEEMGLKGARALVADPPFALDDVLINVNLDMVGRNERGELYLAGTHPYPNLLPVAKAAQARSTLSLLLGHDGGASGGDDWTNASDHAAFHGQGIPFLYFGVEDHPDYHGPGDDSDRIEPEFIGAAAETVLETLRLLDRPGVLGG